MPWTADQASLDILTGRRVHIDRLRLGLPQEDGVLHLEKIVDRLPAPLLAERPRRGPGLQRRIIG
jgi:hypothetical protein